jgi:transcriptional regulator with XRE-family HTH domain
VLADRVGLSASFISQLENGQTHPSLTTLLVVADELGLSIDWLMNVEPAHGQAEPIGVTEGAASHHVEGDGGNNGVWTNLDGTSGNTKFLYVRLEARQSWPLDNHAVQHAGREYGHILSGIMRIDIGACVYTLQRGESIAFDSRGAHRFENPGNEPAHAVWFILEGS